MSKNLIVLYSDGKLNIDVEINVEQQTLWVTQKQMEELFDVAHSTISEHISNILKSGELDETSVGFSDKSFGGRKPKVYNLDMILSVGYRVNAKKGIAFRKWASSILKDYMLKGYAINEKRLESLNKTIEIQSKMLATALDLETDEVYKVVSEYTRALDLLDDYDHQCLDKPKGSDTLYHLSYDECRKLIDSMKFNSDVFGGWKKKEDSLKVFLKLCIKMFLVLKYTKVLKKKQQTYYIS